jgi:hypothetical protein
MFLLLYGHALNAKLIKQTRLIIAYADGEPIVDVMM